MTASSTNFNEESKTGSVTSPSFFGISTLRKDILELVKYAGPLNQLENYIRQAHAKQEPLEATLRQAIRDAVIGLDVDTVDHQGARIDRGMTEKLINLYKELFPENKAKALEEVRLAIELPKDQYLAALESIVLDQKTQQISWSKNEKEEKDRETAIHTEFEKLSDAFTKDNEEILQQAVDTFIKFVSNQQYHLQNKPGLYYANLTHIIDCVKRLPNEWNGKNADCFCSKIIDALRISVDKIEIKQIFDTLITGNQVDIDNAVEKFNEFQKRNRRYSINEQGELTNNLFHINLVYLIALAFEELFQREKISALPLSLPNEIVDRFFIKFIGGLQCDLPSRTKQLLHFNKDGGIYGLYDALCNHNTKATRTIDPNGKKHLEIKDSNELLGVDYFYEISGVKSNKVTDYITEKNMQAISYSDYLTAFRRALNFILYQTHSLRIASSVK